MAPLTSTTFESGELAEVVAVIRSLLLIRKQLTTVRDINDEYRKMEGENIPYHKFGFSSCELMLQRSNQFNLARQSNGQVCILSSAFLVLPFVPLTFCLLCKYIIAPV